MSNGKIVVLGESEGWDYVPGPATVAQIRREADHLGVSDGHYACCSGDVLEEDAVVQPGAIVCFVSE